MLLDEPLFCELLFCCAPLSCELLLDELLLDELLFWELLFWEEDAVSDGVALAPEESVAFAVAGMARLRRDRVRGLTLLRASLLVDLLAGQVFDFVVNQFSAVTNWLVGLCLLAVVSSALRRARQDAAGDQCGSRPRKASSASALS